MNMQDKWIWLDDKLYPDNQKSPYTGSWTYECEDGTVAEFSQSFDFGLEIERVDIRYSGDALVQLWINDRFIGTGPVSIGGDFLANERPRKNRYATELSCITSGEDDYINRTLVVEDIRTGSVRFLARVRLCPVQICEFSMGHGGFMLSGRVYFTDGSFSDITTDESWDAVVCPAFVEPLSYDGSLPRGEVTKPVCIPDVWQTTVSVLPLRVEKKKLPVSDHVFTVGAGKTLDCVLEFDKIYAGYLAVRASAAGRVTLELEILETEADSVSRHSHLIFTSEDEYIGTVMFSIGLIRAKIKNESDRDAILDIAINEAYLPSRVECITETDDEGLNKILEVCRHTLKYCRQYIHLDSPKHCEPSACTGDYYIESMMSAFSFGDMALAEFDAVRTARTLEHNDGVMFHATYSLIWVRMLYDVYMCCGRKGLLTECKKALGLLLREFEKYVGADGIIDTPPSYMFVDWIYIDGISLHHPPKALGQSVINMFYYDALVCAAEIYAHLGEDSQTKKYRAKAEKLRANINERLYDRECGMYFEGQNSPTPAELINNYMPKNVEKRYYRINANALAVAVGVIRGDEARELMHKLLKCGEYEDYQPYFAHYVLRAIHRADLDAEYLMPILDKWRAPVKECEKGLAEGFIPPEPTYSFDHSHAWGGTPLYSLPMALTSLEILEPGMSHIRVSPRLLGLSYARVEIPTPHRVVVIAVDRNSGVNVTAPEGVRVDVI